jgi:putative acetyltransferase
MSVPELVIRAEREHDQAAIAQVVTSAFGSPNEARLVAALRASPSFVPEWSLAATLDESVVGHVMVTYATLRHGSTEHRVASLSPLSVYPEHQRRGVGSALMHAVTPIVDAAHEAMIVLEGSPWYYSRFGFEYAVPLGITIDLPDWAPPEAAQVLRLSRYDSAKRGHLVYPPAFEVLEHETTPELPPGCASWQS